MLSPYAIDHIDDVYGVVSDIKYINLEWHSRKYCDLQHWSIFPTLEEGNIEPLYNLGR